jgi:hypothetical protein
VRVSGKQNSRKVKNKDRTFLLIDVAIPSDMNVIQKEAENKLKYKNLNIEIQRMWNMKCFVIPVIIGATGIACKRLKISGNNTRTAFSVFSTKTRHTRNITHHKESATLVQVEKYQGKENM